MKFDLSTLKSKMRRAATSTEGSDVLRFMNPNRDWLLGLTVAAVLFILGAGYIAYDFYQQFGVPSQAVVVEEQPVVYRSDEVVQYAELYEEKEREFNTLRARRPYVPPATEPEEEVLAE